ncbi:MAG TPA: SMI1/KNR4 family protein [Hymenobacter sp.]|jgi:cell wall assembly regulator SMI1
MVNDSLSRIAHWLSVHAPRILNENLNPGATVSQLANLESMIGKPLPDDYKGLYRRYNGLDEEGENLGNFFYGLTFLPLALVEANYRYRAQATETGPLRKAHFAIKSDSAQRPHWLTLGFDSSHVWLCVDLDPAEGGSYGQVILLDEEEETAFIVADSVGTLLLDFACDLEAGRYSREPEAVEEGQDYLLPDNDIDLINWYRAKRWAAARTL